MNLPDLTLAITRITTLAAATSKEDIAAMTAELRTLERSIRAALDGLKVDVWIAGARGTQIGYGPIANTVASGFQLDLPDGTRVNAFETQAFVSLLYAAAPALVAAIGDELDPAVRRGRPAVPGAVIGRP